MGIEIVACMAAMDAGVLLLVTIISTGSRTSSAANSGNWFSRPGGVKRHSMRIVWSST